MSTPNENTTNTAANEAPVTEPALPEEEQPIDMAALRAAAAKAFEDQLAAAEAKNAEIARKKAEREREAKRLADEAKRLADEAREREKKRLEDEAKERQKAADEKAKEREKADKDREAAKAKAVGPSGAVSVAFPGRAEDVDTVRAVSPFSSSLPATDFVLAHAGSAGCA
jgi:hypothetical protein